MSDLISRSTLIDKFSDTGIQITFDLPVEEKLGEDVDLEAFAELVQDAVQAYKKMVIDVIQNQPTAYNVDAVVEEIKANAQKMSEAKADRPYAKHCPSDHRYYKAIGTHKAEQIIRKGGV